MSEVFISYARKAEAAALRFAEALRASGFAVWRDDELPPHRPYADVIEERLHAAKAVLVIWSADAVKSDWVRAEADVARGAGKLVQLSVDGAIPPMPFNQIQCDDLSGWSGDLASPVWRKVEAAVEHLVRGTGAGVAAEVARSGRGGGKPSIAILPFANLSGDPDQEYFADGMVEEIATALGRYRSIFVVAAGSSLSLKNRGIGPQEAARSLGVRYLLDGSVRKAGGRVRIAVKLVEGASGAQVWAERFEDEVADLFELQDRVALHVAGAIEPAVRESEIQRASERPTERQDSYDLYLRALPHYRASTRERNVEALRLLHRAIELDPDYGAALALAASAHSRDRGFSWTDHPDEDRRRAVELARRALRVAGDDPDVLIRCASVLSQDSEDDVTALFKRALALNPASAIAQVTAANYELSFGDARRAQDHIETSMRLDPLSPLRATQVGMLGGALFTQGRFAEALAAMKECAQLNPAIPQVHAGLAACYAHLGDFVAARAALSQMSLRTSMTIRQMGVQMYRAEAQRALFLEGVAKMEAAAEA
ncbi:MAG TPA: TIR domain-containing protein [Caulobacteraceae bacterium]|jgi:adenylate cyclase|nr:TIR domain-containing protein [Caulobacteraceae bacterium]